MPKQKTERICKN
jgi:hypothetical protein